MKAVILAGGEGTRLRPLTLTLPKPVVPVVDRPFLRHQLDLLERAGIAEVIFSVAYQPDKIRRVFGEGTPSLRIRYLVESTPLGTGGAVKNAEPLLDDTTVVLNGDVLTDLELGALVGRHRASRAAATLFLTPVDNPRAYGLVETDGDARVRRFLEKPTDEQIQASGCDTINAGIYVLETSTLGLMPAGQPHSIERAFFPALLARGDHVAAHVHRGYWIDIGTPEKYLQVHRDILSRSFPLRLDGRPSCGGWVHAEARIDPGAELQGPFYVGPGCVVEAGARIGRASTLVRGVRVRSGARVEGSVLWEGVDIGEAAQVAGAILGAHAVVGRHVRVTGAVLGEGTVLTDYSRA